MLHCLRCRLSLPPLRGKVRMGGWIPRAQENFAKTYTVQQRIRPPTSVLPHKGGGGTLRVPAGSTPTGKPEELKIFAAFLFLCARCVECF